MIHCLFNLLSSTFVFGISSTWFGNCIHSIQEFSLCFVRLKDKKHIIVHIYTYFLKLLNNVGESRKMRYEQSECYLDTFQYMYMIMLCMLLVYCFHSVQPVKTESILFMLYYEQQSIFLIQKEENTDGMWILWNNILFIKTEALLTK